MSGNLDRLRVELRALAIFRALLQDPVIGDLCEYLDCPAENEVQAASAFARFVNRLYEAGTTNLSRYISCIMADDENPYIRTVGRGEVPDKALEYSLTAELEILQRLADQSYSSLRQRLQWAGYLPVFHTESIDVTAQYRERCANIGKYGYGIYAKHRMFYINSANAIVPVHNPDKIRLHSLIDYKREQKIILDNTVALLEGRPAANILLTGDAGTGKSSTVKAVVNELYDRGLRILEVRKEQLHEIPAVLDQLNSNPLKFILFIDDLSFQKDDDNFSALKAILEGSVSAKSRNVVIYATSNRRHLVKETFSDREGDDIHRNDTMQEIISLSERFGIQITFQKPDKGTYLDIVRHLAQEKGITMDITQLEQEAERFALSRGGRSARAANQFIDQLLASQ